MRKQITTYQRLSRMTYASTSNSQTLNQQFHRFFQQLFHKHNLILQRTHKINPYLGGFSTMTTKPIRRQNPRGTSTTRARLASV